MPSSALHKSWMSSDLRCVQDQDFVLPESAAILRYLASTAHTPDHWYPGTQAEHHVGCWMLYAHMMHIAPSTM